MSLQSIAMARLIANDYADNSPDLRDNYGEIVRRKLKNHLNSQAVMAGALGNSVDISVARKESWINKALSYLAESLILRVLVAGGIGALLTAALTLFPFISIAAPAVIGLIGTAISTGAFSLLTSLSKSRAKISAKAFMEYAPSEDMLTMVSDLVVLFNMDKIQLIYSSSKESSLWDKIKESFYQLHRRLAGVKEPRDGKDREIRKFLKEESEKIWKNFADCTHNPEEYERFKSNQLTQKILNFFNDKFELGEPGVEKSRQLEINMLWLTVFAQYLTKSNPELTENFDSKILEKLNTIFSHQVDPERLEKFHAQKSCSSDSLNERIQRLEALQREQIEVLEGKLTSQSVLIKQLQGEVQHLKEELQVSARAAQRAPRKMDRASLSRSHSVSSPSFFSVSSRSEEMNVSSVKPGLHM